jgi:hypothetical protein
MTRERGHLVLKWLKFCTHALNERGIADRGCGLSQ